MDIEIAQQGRMTQTGSSLLKLIQNNNMPILDLLVRESIQNSLDAKMDDTRKVTVHFLTGFFEKERLNHKLDSVEEGLNKRFPENRYEFLAISDKGTKGLTGPLSLDDVEGNEYGNLLKLVYEISKPQTDSGAGGSWGLGKTIYFRIGIGLVIYYSRIKNENGQFENRLAASLVEDETKPNALIPRYKGQVKRGIAWWGQQQEKENETIPIRDEAKIQNILDIFNLSPYSGNDTGTMIIIPYINSEKLLNDNKLEMELEPFWTNNLEAYLNVAVQRWYFPRLNNVRLKNIPWLKVDINQRNIEDLWPVFAWMQQLYNKAKGLDIDKEYQEKINTETINLRNVLHIQEAGKVAFCKLSKYELGMMPPNNYPDPYLFFNLENMVKDENSPILCFSRKPGMVVAYEDSGNWVKGIPMTTSNEFLLSMFVLNSNNLLNEKDNEDYITLEEYIRKSEYADHTSWNDYTIHGKSFKIAGKIKTQTASKIKKAYAIVDKEQQERQNSGLSRKLGDLLLPPEGFGKRSSGVKSKSSKASITRKKTISLKTKGPEFVDRRLKYDLRLQIGKEFEQINLLGMIRSESGDMTPAEFNDEFELALPYDIQIVLINLKNIIVGHEKITVNKSVCLNRLNRKANIEGINFKLLRDNAKKGCGIEITSNTNIRADIAFEVKAAVNNNKFSINFVAIEKKVK